MKALLSIITLFLVFFGLILSLYIIYTALKRYALRSYQVNIEHAYQFDFMTYYARHYMGRMIVIILSFFFMGMWTILCILNQSFMPIPLEDFFLFLVYCSVIACSFSFLFHFFTTVGTQTLTRYLDFRPHLKVEHYNRKITEIKYSDIENIVLKNRSHAIVRDINRYMDMPMGKFLHFNVFFSDLYMDILLKDGTKKKIFLNVNDAGRAYGFILKEYLENK